MDQSPWKSVGPFALFSRDICTDLSGLKVRQEFPPRLMNLIPSNLELFAALIRTAMTMVNEDQISTPHPQPQNSLLRISVCSQVSNGHSCYGEAGRGQKLLPLQFPGLSLPW